MSVQQQYYARMIPYAQRASSATGIPVQVILIQWANESGNGTSNKAKNHNNHGGIKKVGSSIAKGDDGTGFASYSSIDQFVSDYIRVMNLSYYSGVRAAGKTGDLQATIKALGNSPYDAGGYTLNGVKGGKLLAMLGVSVPNVGESPAASATCPHCSGSVRVSLSLLS